jgi:excisionase family DNA binding protein
VFIIDSNILNIEQATEFLGVSEKTLIKLLREENIPSRKIGREWRFSKDALIQWISSGDSYNYFNKNEIYQFSEDEMGKSEDLLNSICKKISILKEKNNIKGIVEVNKDIDIPEGASLRVSYKQQRDVEKLEFKIYWPLRDEFKINIEQNKNSL